MSKIKDRERDQKLKSLLDKEFLDRLKEIGKLYGRRGDYVEIREFIKVLYYKIGISIAYSELKPYEIDYLVNELYP